MLGLGVMILSIAIIRGFKQEIRSKVRGFSGDIQVQKYDNNYSYQNSPIETDRDFVNKVKAYPLITNIMPFATKPAIIKTKDEIEGVVLKGVDKTYDWSFFKKILVEGHVLNFKDSVDALKQVMISSNTASRLKLKVGDRFLMYFVQEPLKKRPFYITGIFDTGVEDVDKTFVVGDLRLIQKLNNWNAGEIGGYELRVADFDKLDTINNYLGDKMPLKLKSYTVTDNFPAIFEWLKLLDVNAQVMLILMLLVAVINMISALLIIILERTSMIGIFKAMGATNWTIQKIFLYNACYLIGIGLILGNIFGLGFSLFQYKTHFFTLDEASYYMKFVPIRINWKDILILNIGTLIISVLVLLIPSTLVSRISPVRAIRFK